MAIGSVADMLARLKAVLPASWFPTTQNGQPSATPVLDGTLSGIGWMFSWLFGLISYAKLQTRIATATDVWLDLIALDYFGRNLVRKNAESDAVFSARIRANLLPTLGTRAAITLALTNLTGVAPIIFEPWNPGDAGGWDTGAFAYDSAGGWGDLNLPAQAFIIAYRQIEGGVATVGGWDGNLSTPAYAPGGWDVGAIEWVDQDQAGTQVEDAEIFATVAATQAEGVVCWTRIENAPAS